MKVYRIIQSKNQNDAFSGEGARLYGGRWNSEGTAAVYAAGTLSLAMLELLVRLTRQKLFHKYIYFSAEIKNSLITALDIKDIPADWRKTPPSHSTMTIGDLWVTSQISAVLEVPSIISPEEKNYLINPSHPDFKKIKINPPKSFQFDERLK